MSRIWCALVGSLTTLSFAQTDDKLTVAEALEAARTNNGTVQAARYNYEAAKASTRAAEAAWWPTLTPSIQREDGRLDTHTGSGRGINRFSTTDSGVIARWLVFDNGTRSASIRRSRVSQESIQFSALDTYRTVLFDVYSVYYNALRAQQLLKVRQSSLARAKTLQDAAEQREAIGAGAKKDIYQAQADALNAQVNVLTATNDVSTTLASLKAVLGWPEDTLPPLDDDQSTQPEQMDLTLEQAIQEGLAQRPSLLAVRKRTELSQLDVTLAKLDAGITITGTANYNKSFSESVFDRQSFAINASIPLFDGSRSRENVRAAQLNLKADQASLLQTERDVRADIESAYQEFRQNFAVLDAAKAARDAAQVNYDAAAGAFREGAGTVLDQLTAQVSLATAEANYIQAYYDLVISEVRLRVAMGRPLPGEVGQ